MIHLLFGEDEFSRQEALWSLKENIGPEELRDVNITVFNGSHVSFEQLSGTCDTIPFMADKRMVVVEGLLSQFEARAPSRSSTRATRSQEPTLGQWEGLADYLPGIPQSTELVLVDGRLSQTNPLLVRIRSLVKARAFPLPSGDELRQWIRQRAESRDISIDPKAITTLAESVGSDLRVIDLELQKLSLYRWGQTVRHEDVQEMVSYAKEASIFAAVDAVIEGRPGVAIRLVHQHLESGSSTAYVISMIARQVRLLLLAKDLKASGISPAEIGKRLSLSSYPLRKTLDQEGRFTHQRLAAIHRKLLEADLSIKTGEADEQLVLDMLVAELASVRQSA